MYGNSGHDTLDSVDGRFDNVNGDSGDDLLYVDYDDDDYYGGSGDDRFFDEFDEVIRSIYAFRGSTQVLRSTSG
jgi:hypothetical protein